MQIKPDQLDAHLQKTLASVYVVSGDEFLLVSESVAAIRKAAQAQGFSERQVYSVERGFDWNQLLQNAGNLSLFGDRQIMELRL